LQLQHIKELYEIAMANVCPKKEAKNEEECRKIVDIANEMDKIIHKNLKLADQLIAKVHRHEGNYPSNELTRSSEESSTEENRVSQERLPSKIAVGTIEQKNHKIRTITTEKTNRIAD